MNNQVFVTNIVTIGSLHCRIIRREEDGHWLVREVNSGVLYSVSPTTMLYAELFA